MERYEHEFNRELKSNNRDLARAYEAYGDAPIWLAVEIMSFGTLSMLYRNTRSKAVRKAVATSFHAKPDELDSWVRAISSVRNTCAHFGRTCNKKLVAKPKRIPGCDADNGNIFYIVLLLLHLLRDETIYDDSPAISYGISMLRDAIQLFTDYEDLLVRAGVPDDWLPRLFTMQGLDSSPAFDECFIKRDGVGNVWFEITLADGTTTIFGKK